MVSKLESNLRKEFNQFDFKTNAENNVKKYLPQILIYGVNDKKINTQFASSTLAIKLVYVNQVYAILQDYGYVKIHKNKSGLNKGMQVCDILYRSDDLTLIPKLGFMNLTQLRKIHSENERRAGEQKANVNQKSATPTKTSVSNQSNTDDEVLVEDSPLQDLFHNVGNALKKQPLQDNDTSSHPLMDWLNEMGQGDEIRPFLESLTAMLADSSANDDTDVAVCDSMESVRHEASSVATQSSKVAIDSAKASVAEVKSSNVANQIANNASDLPFTPESDDDEFEFNNGQPVDDDLLDSVTDMDADYDQDYADYYGSVPRSDSASDDDLNFLDDYKQSNHSGHTDAGQIDIEGLSDGLDDQPVQAEFENYAGEPTSETNTNSELDATFNDDDTLSTEDDALSNEEFMETVNQFLDEQKYAVTPQKIDNGMISTPLTDDAVLNSYVNKKLGYPKDLDADSLNQTDAKDFSDALNAADEMIDDNQILDKATTTINEKRAMLKQLLAKNENTEIQLMIDRLSNDDLDKFIELATHARYAEVVSNLYNQNQTNFEDNLNDESEDEVATEIAPLESLNQDLHVQEVNHINNYPVSMPETFVQPSLNQYISDNFVIKRHFHLDDTVSLNHVDEVPIDSHELIFDIISKKDSDFKVTDLNYQQLMQTAKLLYRSAF